MFYKMLLKDVIRIDPSLFGYPLEKSAIKELNNKYVGYVSQDLGIVIAVGNLIEIGEGKILPEDGGTYHRVTFELFTFVPEMKEVLMGVVRKVEEFGVFLDIGPIDGMVHISQAMDDFVSFSKDGVLQGKESKRTLSVGDVCKARIIAISFRDIENIKIGLTMRQPYLGKLDWIYSEEDKQ